MKYAFKTGTAMPNSELAFIQLDAAEFPIATLGMNDDITNLMAVYNNGWLGGSRLPFLRGIHIRYMDRHLKHDHHLNIAHVLINAEKVEADYVDFRLEEADIVVRAIEKVALSPDIAATDAQRLMAETLIRPIVLANQ